jgi:hypothetical protein
MKLWNEDNEANRKIVQELKDQYNSIVGFISEAITAPKSDEKVSLPE